MKFSDLRTHDQILAEDSPEYIAKWERLAPARAIASIVMDYRMKHDLTQTALARQLGMQQPAIARLERGEHNPSIETIISLCRLLEVEFTLDVSPVDRDAKLVTKRAQTTNAVESYVREHDCLVLMAAV